jgi:ankyrin repeat protein
MSDFQPGVVVKDSEGHTPLMYATKYNYERSVNQLTMQRSNDLNEEDANSMTILMHMMF